MKIRKATEQDLDAIVELDRQIGQIHYEQVPEVFCPPSALQRPFLLEAIQSEGRLFCVAVVNEGVVGFLSARIDINDSIPFLTRLPVCRITTLVVDEQHRSRGIGRALIAHCDGWAKAHDACQLKLEVMSFNARARSLYESLGFKRQSEIYAR